MTLRKLYLVLVTQLACLLVTSDGQNARSYDTNDWIPITPSGSEQINIERKATGRVLNLDAPAQKFFPDNDYHRKKRPQVQQYLRETVGAKGRINGRPPKVNNNQPYKYENVPQFNQQQYYNSKEVNIPLVEQPPPLHQPQYVPSTPQLLQPKYVLPPPPPPPQSQRQQYFQQQVVPNVYPPFNLPSNTTYYQDLNPTSINQELLGEISNNPLPPPPPTVQQAKIQSQVHIPPKQVEQNESVQLLYVPLENLKSTQPVSQDSQAIYRQAPPPPPPPQQQQQQVVNYAPQEVNKQHRIANIEQDFIQQALHAHKLQQQFQLGQPIQYQETYTSTTEKPKKRKPHQPPLAVYMGGKNHAEVTDVLNVLKDAKSIAVQDNVSPDSPNIFIGPSTLDAPQGYSKFPLPYLNNISGSRIERKIEQLPFFVAPLSYKAPPGFSKIPLPSPHVGSVIISHKDEEKLNSPNQYQFTDKPLLKTTAQQISSDYNFGEQPTFLPKENQFEPNKNQYQFDELSHTLPLQFGQQPLVNPQEDLQFRQQYEEPLTYVQKEQPLPQSFDLYNNQHKTTQYEQFPPVKEKSTTTTPASLPVVEFSQTYRPQNNLYTEQPELNKQSFTVQEHKPTVGVTPSRTKEHNINENRVKSSSQTSNPQPNYEQVKQNEQYINPLELAINQYELQQINSQFDLNKANQYNNEQPNYEQVNHFNNPRLPLNGAPQTIVKENYEQVTTTKEPERIRPQRRRKPTRISTTTTTTTTTIKPTESTFEDNKYTVLEEFSVKSNPSSTQQYSPEVITNNYNSYKEETTTPRYADGVEIQAANVYKLNPTATSKAEEITTNRNEQQGELFRIPISQPAYVPENEEIQTVHQHVLDQQLMDRQILNDQYKNSQQPIQSEAPSATQYNSPENVQQYQQNTDHIEPLVSNRGQIPYTDVVDQTSYLQNTQPVLANYHEANQVQSNLAKQVLPGVTNLQEQAVRPLLSPTLLVPTTEEQQQQQQQQSTVKYESPSTENNIEIAKLYSTEPVQVETTTVRGRTRGRGRGNGSRYTPPTTVSPTRRNVSRRRPIPTRTTTERAKINTDYNYYDSSERTTKRTINNSSKQRFRTRGRPATNSITERVSQSTTENEIKAYNSPSAEGVYHSSKLRPEPNSYMQFEHVVDQAKVITIKPEITDDAADAIKDYHQIYDLQQEVNKAETPSVVDVQITHPVSEPTKVTPLQQNERDGTFIQHTAQLGGVLYNNKNNYDETTTSRASTKSRSRTRGRSRFATTTTPRPTTRLTTTTEYVEAKDNGNDVYGFIRNTLREDQPSQARTYTQQPTQLYSSTYQSSQKPLIVINAEDSDTNENKASTKSVQFVGQIRPKYQNEETTQKPKTRARIRVPTRKTQEQKQSYNEVSAPGGATEQATRRSSVIRSRGRAHYKVPENLRKKVEVEIDENQNYPPSFFKNRATTTTTKPNNFQITIGPNSNVDDIEDDQAPHPSIYSPRFVPKPVEEWTEISSQPLLNQIPMEEKTNTDMPHALPIVNTDVPIANTDADVEDETQTISTVDVETTTLVPSTETVTKKKGRRRGVWKLVRHRPVDHFETAESQNYQSVINTFDNIEKVYPNGDKFVGNDEKIESEYTSTSEATPNSASVTTTEESSIFDTLYEMFGMKGKNDENNTSESEISAITATTTAPPTFPEELTEIPSTVPAPIEENNSTSTVQPDTVLIDTTTVPVIISETTIPSTTTSTTTTTTTTTQSTTKSAYEVEPWEMRAVKTSTSTEVSHETEICYKGRCIKSKNRKING